MELFNEIQGVFILYSNLSKQYHMRKFSNDLSKDIFFEVVISAQDSTDFYCGHINLITVVILIN